MMQDKTLADYIRRIQEQQNKEPAPASNDDVYTVVPEDDGTDTKRNPYSQH